MVDGDRGKKMAGRNELQEKVKPLRPSQCRSYMRRELAAKFPEIVKGFVKGAKAGSCAHVKLATELLAQPDRKPRRRKGSAGRLLDELLKEQSR